MSEPKVHPFRRIRLAAGLSGQQAAERIGVSRQAISLWELGRSLPRRSSLLAIRLAYGLSVDEMQAVYREALLWHADSARQVGT